MTTVNVKIYNAKEQIKELQVTTNGKPTVIKADKNVNYEFFDQAIGKAPNHIITKRVGKDLHVSFDRDGKEDNLVIEDFYSSDNHTLIGLAEDGNYYYYIPDTGEVNNFVTQLADGGVEGQALGGEHLAAPLWVALPTTALSAAGLPWWLGLGIVPFLFKNNDNNDSKDEDQKQNTSTDDNNLSALILPDVEVGQKGQPVPVDMLKNDRNIGNLDTSTVKLIDPVTHQPTDKIVVPGQGTWAQDPANPAVVIFTPEPGFVGNPTPINYTVTDKAGHQLPPAPVAVIYDMVVTPDSKPGVVGSPVTQDVIGNDGAVDATTVKLIDPATGQPTNTVVVPGQGTWTQDPSHPNLVTFTPEPGFTGDPNPIKYTVIDKDGNPQTTTIDVSYPENPNITTPDVKPGTVGQPVTQTVTNNDGDVNPTSVRLIDPNHPNNPPTNHVDIPGQGTWTVDNAGNVTFTPEPGFTGNPAPINYIVNDNSGNPLPPTPVNVVYPLPTTPVVTNPTPDIKAGELGQPVTQHVADNDGNVDPTTVKLIDPVTRQPVDKIEVPNEGTWTLIPSTGEVTFTPNAGFNQDPTPITYIINDKKGNTLTPTTVSVDYPDGHTVVPSEPITPAPVPTPTPTPEPTPTPAPTPGDSTPTPPAFPLGDDMPRVSITGLTDVNEAVGAVTYTVTLDRVLDHDLTVSYIVANRRHGRSEGLSADPTSETEDADFENTLVSKAHDIVIPKGQTSVQIVVNIKDDDHYERVEDYTVSLAHAYNQAAINYELNQVQTTIHDDGTSTTDGRDPFDPRNHTDPNDPNSPLTPPANPLPLPDNDSPFISLTGLKDVNEAVGTVNYTIQLTDKHGNIVPSVEDIQITYEIKAGSSANPAETEDLTNGFITKTITLPKGSSSITIPVDIKNDYDYEVAEDYNIAITGVQEGRAIIKPENNVTTTIHDDGTATTDGRDPQDPSNHTDPNDPNSPLTPPATPLPPADNDMPQISITGITDVNEAVGTVGYTVHLTHKDGTPLPAAEDIVVNYQVKAGTSGNPAEANDLTEGFVTKTITIPKGSSSVTIPVDVVNDNEYEIAEDYNISLTSVAQGTATISDKNNVTTIIHDDGTATTDGRDPEDPNNHTDPNNPNSPLNPPATPLPPADNDAPKVSITGLTDVNEGVGEVQYTLHMDKTNSVDTVVTVVLTNGTAELGTDYNNPTTLTITIPAGQNSATVNVPIINDTPAVFEGAENYTISIDSITGGATKDPDVNKTQVTTTIHDDGTGSPDGRDPQNPGNHTDPNDPNSPLTPPANPLPPLDNDTPMIGNVTSDSKPEGQDLVHTVTLTNTSTTPTVFDFKLTDGSAKAGEDYTNAPVFSNGVTYDPATGKITVPAGVIDFTVTYPTTPDNVYEPDETTNIQVGDKTATGTIQNDDPMAAISSVGDATIAEGGNLVHTVTLNNPSSTDTIVDFKISNGTADDTDYQKTPTFSNGVTYDPATGKITIPAGVADFTVTYPTNTDNIYEQPETTNLTIGGLNGVGTITDTSGQPKISGILDATAPEGDNLVHNVTLTNPSSTPIEFDFKLNDNTAIAGQDYTNAPTFSNGVTYDPATGKITVPAGVVDFTVTYPTIQDTIFEPDETTSISIGDKTATGTITNDDAKPEVADITSDRQLEGTDLTHTVTLTNASSTPTTFDFKLTDGTAKAGEDYTNAPVFSDGVTYDPATGQITVPAGVTQFTFHYPTTQDNIFETEETTNIQIGNKTATGTILNDDAEPKIDSITPDTKHEGETLSHSVTLTNPSSTDTFFVFKLEDGTATAGQDYTNQPTFTNGVTYDPATGQIKVPAGVTQFDIQYPALKDDIFEQNETTKVTVGDKTVEGTILDGSAAPAIGSITDDIKDEGTPLSHTVTLTNPSATDTFFDFTLNDGTAIAGQDYTNAPTFTNGVTYDPATGKIKVPAGVTSFVVQYPTTDDNIREPNETTKITVGGITATGNIRDNDPVPTVQSITSDTKPEGIALSHTVTLTNPSTTPTVLDFKLENGTAIAGQDYTNAPRFSAGVTYDPATGKITVPAGVTSFTVDYDTLTDTIYDPNETTKVTVGGMSATGTITDNNQKLFAHIDAPVHVSEEGLPNGNKDTTSSGQGTNTGTSPDANNDTTDSTINTSKIIVDDIDTSLPSLSLTLGNPPTSITSGGKALIWVANDPANPTSWTAYTDPAHTEKVITVSVGNKTVIDGTHMTYDYTTELFKAIDHPLNSMEDNYGINFNIVLKDGATVLQDSSALVSIVEDDSPKVEIVNHNIQVAHDKVQLADLQSGFKDAINTQGVNLANDTIYDGSGNVPAMQNTDADPIMDKIFWGDQNPYPATTFYQLNDNDIMATSGLNLNNLQQQFQLGIFTHNNTPSYGGVTLQTTTLQTKFTVNVNNLPNAIDVDFKMAHLENSNIQGTATTQEQKLLESDLIALRQSNKYLQIGSTTYKLTIDGLISQTATERAMSENIAAGGDASVAKVKTMLTEVFGNDSTSIPATIADNDPRLATIQKGGIAAVEAYVAIYNQAAQTRALDYLERDLELASGPGSLSDASKAGLDTQFGPGTIDAVKALNLSSITNYLDKTAVATKFLQDHEMILVQSLEKVPNAFDIKAHLGPLVPTTDFSTDLDLQGKVETGADSGNPTNVTWGVDLTNPENIAAGLTVSTVGDTTTVTTKYGTFIGKADGSYSFHSINNLANMVPAGEVPKFHLNYQYQDADKDTTVGSTLDFNFQGLTNNQMINARPFEGQGDNNDYYVGSSQGEVINGNAGDDTLIGNGGADTLNGGAGNDVLFYDKNDTMMNGGDGDDTLSLINWAEVNSAGTLNGIDLSNVSNVTNIEKIDMTNNVGLELKLTTSSVLAMTDADHKLFITGDSSDSVNTGGAFTKAATSDVAGYNMYTGGGATLYIESDITNVI